MFIPLMKADAAQRLVYGSVDETPDRAKEVMDYATAKAAFQDWSSEMQKASDGKSFGNIRGQHSNIAAGKLAQEIVFNDDDKRIEFCAHIVDDNEWRKVEEGVYTGFSPGGKYAKRWQDGENKRYTPVVRELSIVDIPCIPSATFTMVKADGAEEQVEFAIDKAYEPGNEATLARAEELAKAAGTPKLRKDYVGKARADLIAEEADRVLAKMDDAPEQAPGGAIDGSDDPVAKIEAALAKADAVKIPTTEADAPDVPEQFSDLAKAAAALKLLKNDAPLAKGLYTIGWIARLMEEFASLQGSLALEAGLEGDGSAAPAKSIAIVKAIGELLVSVAQEEVAEALSSLTGGDVEVVPLDDGDDVMALASSIVDLVKADTDLMEKAGKRNSAKDQAMLQSMHDNSVSLGATCDADANKDALAALEADRDRMAKALDSSVPKIEALTEKVEGALGELAKANARIAELESRPEMAKGAVFAVDKEQDGRPITEAQPEKALSLVGQALQIAAKR